MNEYFPGRKGSFNWIVILLLLVAVGGYGLYYPIEQQTDAAVKFQDGIYTTSFKYVTPYVYTIFIDTDHIVIDMAMQSGQYYDTREVMFPESWLEVLIMQSQLDGAVVIYGIAIDREHRGIEI